MNIKDHTDLTYKFSILSLISSTGIILLFVLIKISMYSNYFILLIICVFDIKNKVISKYKLAITKIESSINPNKAPKN